MRTGIAQSLKGSRTRWPLALVCASIVGADLAVVMHFDRGATATVVLRLAMAGSAALACYLAAGRDRRSLGLTPSLSPSRRWWIKASVVLGALVLAVMLAFSMLRGGAAWELGQSRPFSTRAEFVSWAMYACILAPIVEETLYRLAICVPLVSLKAPWAAICLSGFSFAFLHVLYGNPAPDNQIAGFLLAWAYVRSGSLLLPIVLHSAGNLLLGLYFLFSM